jgi:cell division protein FtsN
MARREGRGSRRDDGQKNARKGGSLFTGLMIGLAMGMAMAAGVAWYLNMTPNAMKAVESISDPVPKDTQQTAEDKAEAKAQSRALDKQAMVEPPAPKRAAKPEPAPKTESAPAPRPKVNYTFYGILPGDKPARPEPPPSKDTWWLQIAALSDPKKADQIRAKLVLLNLRASTQKIDSNGQPLYRIRVGPYKREDDAFGDLDILTENDFNARLLKDPVNPN